jgi:uncharacterized protein (TIGR02217 family)
MSLAFLESPIDERYSRGAEGGPFQPGRRKLYDGSGRLTQTFTNDLALHRYDISHGIKSRADYQAIVDLFYVVMFTPYAGFRFKDWRDYQLTQANSRLVLVSGSNYQIHRVHAFGGQEFLRPIYKPRSGVVVYRKRSGVTSAATATVDTTTGVATISGHVSGDTYSCEGDFDVPVTFVDDEWIGELQGSTGNLFVTSSIKLEEIRL